MLVLLWALVFGGGDASAPQQAPPRESFYTSALPPSELQGKQAVLETTYGTIVLDLLEDAAPNHVAHFIERVREGAYDGTTFHRVIAMGIVQGGDPISRDPAQAARHGTGGLGALGFEPNDEKHTRGAVSAVLVPGDRDSAGSQFFIAVTDQLALDGQYTVFARVFEGITVAQRISVTAADATVPSERIEIVRATIRDAPVAESDRFLDATVDELSVLQAVIETSIGSITVEFSPDRAPSHVRQFLRLASAGVYDGTALHRVSRGFVIQGGHLPTRREPLEPWQEALVRPLPPEFNATPHARGILSMARGEDPASATSSFFLVLDAAQGLDGQYTVFGRVADGLAVVDAVEAVPVDGETPLTRIEVMRVTIAGR